MCVWSNYPSFPSINNFAKFLRGLPVRQPLLGVSQRLPPREKIAPVNNDPRYEVKRFP